VSDSLSKPHREEEVDDLAIELCDFLSGRTKQNLALAVKAAGLAAMHLTVGNPSAQRGGAEHAHARMSAQCGQNLGVIMIDFLVRHTE